MMNSRGWELLKKKTITVLMAFKTCFSAPQHPKPGLKKWFVFRFVSFLGPWFFSSFHFVLFRFRFCFRFRFRFVSFRFVLFCFVSFCFVLFLKCRFVFWYFTFFVFFRFLLFLKPFQGKSDYFEVKTWLDY
jgi:hypothetical protein